jgi:HEXXH motif-containing protein
MITLAAATRWLDRVPDLAQALRTHVGGFSLLQSHDDAYDVTHSEPRWPAWIFVSCPATPGEVSELRLAENVVHEAMHLQLTQVESRTRLVEDEGAALPSPWKQELRDLRGILHGLYVFCCIKAFLNHSNVASASSAASKYAARRTAEIEEEIADLPIDALREGLTSEGRAFLSALSG